MSVTVNLHGGPLDGTTVTVGEPWPRGQVVTEAGGIYRVTDDDPSSADATYVEPEALPEYDDPFNNGGVGTVAEGPQGPPGNDGDPGADGEPGPVLNWTGEWNVLSTYDQWDAVRWDNAVYVAAVSGIAAGVEPLLDESTPWALWIDGGAGSGGGGTGSFDWQGTWDDEAAYTLGAVVNYADGLYYATADVDEPTSSGGLTIVNMPGFSQAPVDGAVSGVGVAMTLDSSDPAGPGTFYKGEILQLDVGTGGDLSFTVSGWSSIGSWRNVRLFNSSGTLVTDLGSVDSGTLSSLSVGRYYVGFFANPSGGLPQSITVTVTNGTGALVVYGAAGSNPTPDVDTSHWDLMLQDTTGGGGGSSVTVVTALPGSPADGDECILQTSAMATAGVAWHVRYISALTGRKWVVIGGDPLVHEIAAEENSSNNSFVDLTTTGPTVAVPVDGHYDVMWGSLALGNSNNVVLMGIAYTTTGGSQAAVDGVSSRGGGVNGLQGSTMTRKRINDLSGGTNVVAKYRTTSSQGTWGQRFVTLMPVRL